ncbi:hypothetical protein QR685DRAFT_574894 [Neurospora intermedia]|uniref:Uncharacterized protein n=1 Tax=Neurospora intermedia TaxID=5142 RepID=A0ABR3D2A6_NEUIN
MKVNAASNILASNNNNCYYIFKTNIFNNPYITTYYFFYRFELFKKYILIPKFKINNFYTDFTNIQNKLKPYKYFIINEKFILGIRTIYYINAYLRKWFSSANILLLIDFFN